SNLSQDRHNQRHRGLLCSEKASQESLFSYLARANQLICDSPAVNGEKGKGADIDNSSTQVEPF
ncbi:hypothetical protein, partial [Mesorhizobium caraganae]|uniref:hypothetical protein n=1 Tax=Mesorhizobium caraganae TaxID=483206 RepID=UPI001AF0166F